MNKQPLLYSKNAVTGANLDLLLQLLDDFVVVLDKNGRIIQVNAASLKLTGYQQEEVIGRSIAMYDAIGSETALLEEAGQLLHGVKDKAIASLRCKDGHLIQVEYRAIKVVWDDEKALLLLGKDVSDASSIKQALLESISQQRALLDNFPFQAWMKELDGTYIAVNKSFAATVQRTPEQIIGRTDYDFLPEAVAKDFALVDQQVIAEKRQVITQSQVWEDGKSLWWETHKSPIITVEGEVIGIAGLARDISNEKNVSHKLERNIEQYKLLTEVAYQYSLPQRFSEATDKVLTLVGDHLDVSRVYIFEDNEEGTATTNTYEWVKEGVAPQKDELVDVPYELIPNWKPMLENEGLIFSKNISTLPDDIRAVLEPQHIISLLIYPLYVDGAFHGFIGFDECAKERVWESEEIELLKTITHVVSNAIQRNKSLMAVQESGRKYRELVELLPEMICETNADMAINFANQLAIKKLGIKPAAVSAATTSVFDLFPDYEQKRLRNNLQRLLKGEQMKGVDYEYEALNAQGHLFPALLYVSVIHEKGQFAGIRGVMMDITERKQTEIKLREAKENAERASEAKQNFLATMSHEIRTPLNAIVGSVHLMRDEQDPAERAEHLSTLEFASKNLLALINDILDFSKIEAGRIELDEQDFNLPQLLRKCVSGFMPKADSQRLTLRLNGDSDLPEVMIGDSGRLAQIMNNLINNAIKFTKHGSVDVDAQVVGIKGNTKWLEVQVRDTGIGIPEHKLTTIWDSFVQLDDFKSRMYEGSGLGLAITRKLVDLMQGEISVESKVGVGSTFTVTIPLRISKASTRKSDRALDREPRNLKGTSILIVEDNLVNQRIAARFLQRWQASVEIAANGKIALERIADNNYDLVLMDLQMPIMDGYTCAKAIRQLPDGKAAVPIIALTASALLEVQKEVLGAGMNDFITKPFNPEDLYKKIARALH